MLVLLGVVCACAGVVLLLDQLVGRCRSHTAIEQDIVLLRSLPEVVLIGSFHGKDIETGWQQLHAPPMALYEVSTRDPSRFSCSAIGRSCF